MSALSGPEGLLLIDKPEGPTSHEIVSGVRRLLGSSRVGHAGTLDPFATGLLLVALGRATRLVRFLAAADKIYEGVVRFGFATDTDDRTGRPLSGPRPVAFSDVELKAAVERLSGEFEQFPPAFSARKHRGVPLYRLARKGRAVPRRPAQVRIEWGGWDWAPPDTLRLRVTVSAGTYIRSLARDLGDLLGCGAHLDELRRVASGCFTAEEAVSISGSPDALRAAIRPIESIPLGLPAVAIGTEACHRIRCGATVPFPAGACARAGGLVRLLDPERRLVALAELAFSGDGGEHLLKPRVVL